MPFYVTRGVKKVLKKLKIYDKFEISGKCLTKGMRGNYNSSRKYRT